MTSTEQISNINNFALTPKKKAEQNFLKSKSLKLEHIQFSKQIHKLMNS